MDKPKVTVNGVQDVPTEKSIGLQIWEVAQLVGALLYFLIQCLYCALEGIYRKFSPKPPKSVRGEIVLITGTGHGIGRELALLYAAGGATVVGWDINEENNKQTMNEIEQLKYPKPYSYVCDVSNRDNVLEVAKKVQQEVGDVTILINNAGIMPTHPFSEQTTQEIEKTMGINVMAHFWTLEAFLPAMKKTNNGHIVCLSSLAGQLGNANLVPYCASKFAVRGMMEALHEELRYYNKNNRIQITVICPFMVNTGLCKRPKIRFEAMMPILDAKSVAQEIFRAQRTNISELCLPEYIGRLNNLRRLFPQKPCEWIKDFLEAVVESDL